jgi:hypothetical protein
MPRPWNARIARSSPTGGSWSSSWKPPKDSAMSTNPAAQTAFAPNRSARRVLDGAMTAIPTATGMSAAPLCRGL